MRRKQAASSGKGKEKLQRKGSKKSMKKKKSKVKNKFDSESTIGKTITDHRLTRTPSYSSPPEPARRKSFTSIYQRLNLLQNTSLVKGKSARSLVLLLMMRLCPNLVAKAGVDFILSGRLGWYNSARL